MKKPSSSVVSTMNKTKEELNSKLFVLKSMYCEDGNAAQFIEETELALNSFPEKTQENAVDREKQKQIRREVRNYRNLS